jgi:predicted metal-binding protein
MTLLPGSALFMAAETVIFVCTTCQRNDVTRQEGELRSGETLLHLLQAQEPAFRIEAVSCMNNCVNGCTVGFGAAEKWTYVFGDVAPDQHIADILAVAAFHQASETGEVPWSKRPEGIKRKTVSRTPPLFNRPKAA